MKKVAVMLLVGGLMLTGCGATTESTQKDVAVEESAPTVEVNTDDSASVSEAAIEDEPAEEETEEQEYLTPDEQFIKDHTVEYENTVAEDNSSVYFPEATNLKSGKEALDNVLYWKVDKDNLDFTMKHIRYDFLVTEEQEGGVPASISNLYSIGAKLKSDYIKDLGVDESDLTIEENVTTIDGTPGYYCYIGVTPEEAVLNAEDFTSLDEVDEAIEAMGVVKRPGTVILAYPTLDDANNGVTVVELKNVDLSECSF